jgi:hypothetical protein
MESTFSCEMSGSLRNTRVTARKAVPFTDIFPAVTVDLRITKMNLYGGSRLSEDITTAGGGGAN